MRNADAPTIANLPRVIPVFPLAGALLLPRRRLPLNIFEPRYLAMIDDALRHHRLIGMVQPANDQRQPQLYPVGCLGRLTSWSETDDGRFVITLTGVARFRIQAELAATTPYRQVEAVYGEFEDDLHEGDDDAGIDRERLGATLKTYFKQRKIDEYWQSIDQVSCEVLINSLAMICPFEVAEKQALLEAPALADRAKLLTALIEMAAADGGVSKGTLQ